MKFVPFLSFILSMGVITQPVHAALAAAEQKKISTAGKDIAAVFWKGSSTLAKEGQNHVSLADVIIELSKRSQERPIPKGAKGEKSDAAPTGKTDEKKALKKTRARGIGKRQIEMFKKLDANSDGNLTQDELSVSITNLINEGISQLQSLDADNDGNVSPKEYALGIPGNSEELDQDGLSKRQRRFFDSLDKDHNNLISLTESIQSQIKRSMWLARTIQLCLRIDQLDTNKDQKLDHSETKTAVPGWLGANETIKLNSTYFALFRLNDEQAKQLDQHLK